MLSKRNLKNLYKKVDRGKYIILERHKKLQFFNYDDDKKKLISLIEKYWHGLTDKDKKTIIHIINDEHTKTINNKKDDNNGK